MTEARPTPDRRSRHSSHRGVSSGLTAILVVVVMTFAWWLFSGNGPGGGPRGTSGRPDIVDVDAHPEEATGSPGPVPTPSPPQLSNVNGVPIASFAVEAPRTLVLDYRSGPVRCAGALDTPEVLETDASVTVTLTLVPPSRSAPCRRPAQARRVVVDLDTDLGSRSVLDGSYSRRVAVPGAR